MNQQTVVGISIILVVVMAGLWLGASLRSCDSVGVPLTPFEKMHNQAKRCVKVGGVPYKPNLSDNNVLLCDLAD